MCASSACPRRPYRSCQIGKYNVKLDWQVEKTARDSKAIYTDMSPRALRKWRVRLSQCCTKYSSLYLAAYNTHNNCAATLSNFKHKTCCISSAAGGDAGPTVLCLGSEPVWNAVLHSGLWRYHCSRWDCWKYHYHCLAKIALGNILNTGNRGRWSV